MTRKGSSMMDPRDPAHVRAFFRFVRPTRDVGRCWNWRGRLSTKGYAQHFGYLAYPFVYEAFYGKPRRGLYIRHVCDNKRCVNPRHLVAGTASENVRDKHVAERALSALARAHGLRAPLTAWQRGARRRARRAA